MKLDVSDPRHQIGKVSDHQTKVRSDIRLFIAAIETLLEMQQEAITNGEPHNGIIREADRATRVSSATSGSPGVQVGNRKKRTRGEHMFESVSAAMPHKCLFPDVGEEKETHSVVIEELKRRRLHPHPFGSLQLKCTELEILLMTYAMAETRNQSAGRYSI